MRRIFVSVIAVVFAIGYIAVPGIVFAQTDFSDAPTVAQSPQALGEIWKPGYPLVPCGGYVTIDDATGTITMEQPECNFKYLLVLTDNIITFLTLYLSVSIAVIVFAIAGFKYIFAGGNPGKIQSAHTMFTNAFIGLVIGLASFLIIHTIASNLLRDSINSYVEENILNE